MLILPTVRSGTLILLVALLRSPATTVAVPPPSSVQASAIGADATAGKHLFERHCAACHGIEGKGGRGPGVELVCAAFRQVDKSYATEVSNSVARSTSM